MWTDGMRLLILLSQWLIVAAAVGGTVPGFRGFRPIDTHWPEDRSIPIEWKEDWEKTYKANMERWEKEVARATRQGNLRDLRLRLRRVRLLEALIQRYPQETDRRIEARSTIADDLVRAGFRGRSNYVLKQLIDEFPGRPLVAAAACKRILEATPWEHPDETEEGRAWVAYAASRLLALAQVGAVPGDHGAVTLARRAMVMADRSEGRLVEAAELLDSMKGEKHAYWRSLVEADLLASLGRGEEALRRYTELYRQTEDRELKARISRLSNSVFEIRPTFPGRLGLEVRWEMLEDVAVAEAATRLAGLLAADSEGSTLVPWGEARHRSLWAAVDAHLVGQPEAARLLLRQIGGEEAGRALRAARRAGDAEALLAVYRRSPWSAAGTEALLDYGERELRQGHGGLAARSFRDVLAHAADAESRARAQVGLWLSLAPRRAALEAAFEGIAPEAPYPWLGRPTPARVIRERLLGDPAADGAAEAPALAALVRRPVRMPPASPWPRETLDPNAPKEVLAALDDLSADLQLDGRLVLVSGPNVLCAYRDDLAHPAWTRTSSLLHGRQGVESRPDAATVILPGVFRPAIVDGRVVTRWGLEPSRGLLGSVAAFDAASGAMLWSTAGDPDWEGSWPLGDPAVADGRVYVLAAPATHLRVLPVLSVSLACMELADGRLLWRRKLASHNYTLPCSRESGFYERHFDLVHHGNAVTVADGAVYCSTNMGFVARCDARDGVVEWTRSYPRVQIGGNALRLVRRRGGRPLVANDLAVFAPRDYPGVFALDRRTGEPRWDNAFAPSAYPVGLTADAALFGDDDHVAALDLASGRTRWYRRFEEGILGRPVVAGDAVYVGTASQLHRIAAATGQTLERTEWGAQGAMQAFALRGRELVGLTEQSAGAQRQAAGTPLNPRAPGGAQPLRLPMRRSWSLLRANPRLVVPPPEAQLRGRLFLLSEDALECVEMTARGAVVWRRLLALGFKALAWAPKTLLFIYPRRAVAVDAETGTLRWERTMGFPIRRWQVAGPHLVLRAYERSHRGRRTAAIEIASGKLLWDRSFRGLGYDNNYNDHLPYTAWDGRQLHLIGRLALEEKGCYDVVCRPADGHIEAVRRILPRESELPAPLVVEGTQGFYLSKQRQLHEFALGGGNPRRYNANLRDLDPRYLRSFELVGPWLRIHEVKDDRKQTVWILRRGDPGYELRRNRPGTLRGDRLYEITGDHTLTVIHLPSRREERTFTTPPTRGFFSRILDFYEIGNTLLVVSGLDAGEAWRRRPARLRVDTFERSTGRHLGGQVLHDVAYWKFVVTRDWRSYPTYQTETAWHDGVLFVTDFHGLHAFTATAPDDPSLERPVHVAYRASQPIVADGALDEWQGQEPVVLKAPGRPDGRLLVAHDGEQLYLAVACHDADARPRLGQGDYGAGDWLEVGVTVGERSSRFGMGIDAQGRVTWQRVGTARFPEGLEGQVGGDPASRQRIYELAAPLRSLAGDGDPRRLREIGVSLAVWDEEPRQGPVRTHTWGTALLGREMLPARHERIRLHPLTRDAQEAGLALARELPWLAHAWAFFRDECRTHAGSPSRLKALHRAFLARHRDGPAAVRALVHLDQMLRVSPGDDPTAEVLKLAEQAGVSREARSRYHQLTEVYLSQWVHIDPKTPPSSLLFELGGYAQARGGGHRVFWGDDVWHDGTLNTPTRRDGGGLPPAGNWVELRFPLIWLDHHDRPIHALGYSQRGGYNVIWDRLAVGRPGREHVIIEDKLPAGKTYGNWRWVGHPRRSGSRAHSEGQNLGQHSTARRLLYELKQPVVEHIIPDPRMSYLSQWVYIERPTKMLMVNLHDGSDWRRACWGEPHREARYIGPLPARGSWRELRLPLDRFLDRPIRGIAFGREGGKVYWDRTALVMPGRERMLIEDELPKGYHDPGDWEWVEKPVRSGKLAHTLKRQSGSYREHSVHSFEEPVLDHMAIRPEQAAAILRQHLPKLGASEVAWRFFEDLLRLSPSDPESRIEQYTWFIRHLPDHHMAIHVLTRLLAHYRDVQNPDPLAAVEAVIADSRLPAKVCYEYRRKYAHPADCFVRQWLLLGPFPNVEDKGFDTAFPPETEPVDLARAYRGARGEVRWRPHRATADAIDLAKFFTPNEEVVAYAVCWVDSPRSQAAILELGSDDGCKVWVNRKLVFALHQERSLVPRQNIVPIRLRRGANELLLKIEQGKVEWGFAVELVGADGRSLLGQVTLTTVPPRPPR